MSVEYKIVARGNFISSVAEECRHPYAAELCGPLSIMSGVDYVFLRSPHPSQAFNLKIGSDCKSVLHSLWNASLVTTLSTYLHQVAEEIGLLRDRWLAIVKPIKIADQDRLKSHDQLSWLEFLNTKYDKQVKELICNEKRELVPFPFSLQSACATSSMNNLTLNMKENINVAISLSAAEPYLRKKLQNESAFDRID